ncbi:aldehyde dehydrogenase family protein [Rhodococcus sp. MEB064]|uniref:aldehyde dehydrogenase family protein n=1 Tax=Rhodococcus sp. MEB064 TaxID=1587522 RepID=UPI0005ACDB0A|nr:aldehyde dehydrogenase family protein [Rhodococcus sp. MEB064]
MSDTKATNPVDHYVTDRDFTMLIDGKFVHGGAGETSTVVDPSTGSDITEVPVATADDVRSAVAAAARAQPAWEALGVGGRSACFAQFRALVRDNRERLAMLDSIDCGNPVSGMRRDIDNCDDSIDGYPAMAKSLTGEVYPGDGDRLHYSAHRAYGVVGRINAFNHPALFALTRSLPALITGNTVVMKPSEETSLSTLAAGELFAEAFPPGVVNIVTGGAEVGDGIVTHPSIKRLGFVGSVPTGLLIQKRGAESGHVKQFSLELGGKNAMVVFPDVDLDEVVQGAISGMNMTTNAGQACGSNSRVVVHARIYDEFVTKLAAALGEYRMGVAYSDDTDIGPLVSRKQWSRVTGYVQAGVEDGATLVRGGGRPDGLPEGGNYLEPTLFADVTPNMRIAREEIFGPVISVFRWDDYDEMLTLVNGVDFGLTSSVWTNDLAVAHRTADAIQAGYVWINDSTQHFFGTPFGGWKNSGIGREDSKDEVMSYLEQKVVHARFGDARSALRKMMG